MNYKYTSLVKQGLLVVLIFGSGIITGNYLDVDTHSIDYPVFKVDNKQWNAQETIEGLIKFDSGSVSNFIRNYAIYSALNDKYGSEYVEQKVDQEEFDAYKNKNIDPNDPTAPQQLGFNSKEELRNYYRLNTLIDRYIDDKITDKMVEEKYKTWHPSVSLVVVPKSSVKDIDQLLKEWESVESKSANTLYSFLKDKDLPIDTIDVPSHQKLFNQDSYKKILELKEFEGGIIDSPNGQDEILAFPIIKKEKTNLETDKNAVRVDIKEEMQSNDIKFIKDIMDDLGIEGSETVPLEYHK